MSEFDTLIIMVFLMTIFFTNVKHKFKHIPQILMKILILWIFVLAIWQSYFVNEHLVLTISKIVLVSALIINLFHLEIKKILHHIGFTKSVFDLNYDENLIEEIEKVIEYLTKKKRGALITFERDDNLDDYIDNSFMINGMFSSELISTIFGSNSPLHDGAIIIRGNMIKCAGAYYPTTERTDLPKILGTRHRAALGISEIRDAFTIIISEETGELSVTVDGNLDKGISIVSLKLYIEKYLKS